MGFLIIPLFFLLLLFSQFQDGMNIIWDAGAVSNELERFIKKNRIETVLRITFYY